MADSSFRFNACAIREGARRQTEQGPVTLAQRAPASCEALAGTGTAGRHSDAFEPGCSIGVLTRILAPRCGRLLSCDAAQAAVRQAQDRTSALRNVRAERRALPRDWPPGEFSLIVLSELLYYFDYADLDQILGRPVTALRPDGHLLAVHWRHEASGYPRARDNAHEILRAHEGLALLSAYRDPDFIAEVYAPAGGDRRAMARPGA
jgi:trans-aconitate methyltransferase